MKLFTAMFALLALVATLGACSETTTTKTSRTEATIAGPAHDPVVLERKSTTVETRQD